MTDPREPGAPRRVGHRRRPVSRPRLRRGRMVVLGGAVTLTMGIAIASLVLPDGEASAESGTGALVAAAVEPSLATAASVPSPAPSTETPSVEERTAEAAPPPPADSGAGRRIVFDQSDQRVWLIETDEVVDRTYLVSGSRFDNLQPGTYSVQSRQRHAVAFDHSGTMEYFLRFATGRSEPIGFHAIPVYNNGEPEQTVAELGTPLSAGCVRQTKSDAKYLWDWAPDGTTVVVTE